MDSWKGKGEWGVATTEFSVIIVNFFVCVDFQKRHKVTEAVVFVSVNFSIYSRSVPKAESFCHSHSDSP